MISLNNVTLRRGTRVLLEQINWTIYHKQRIGLIGANGCGKSSLFSMLQNQLHPDTGELNLPTQLRIAHVAQETPALAVPTIEYVMGGDRELAELQSQLNQAEQSDDGTLIAELHVKLADIDGYTATARAAQLLVGLGFTHTEQYKQVKEFSGGWRVRLNLARALMARSDMLLLDEPTNHLDLDAVIWLEQWLKNYHGTLILISHDREFLDKTVNNIVYIKNNNLKSYSGDYSTFETLYAQELMMQQAAFDKQQKKIQHMMAFVNRFKAKASKAKQAQSRVKAIERMDLVCAVQSQTPFQFEFRKPDECPYPMLQVNHGRIQYDERIILDKINLSLSPSDRIGVLGPNGAGKSSLIKVLAGDLAVTKGVVELASGLKVGYFAQHQVDHLKLRDTAMEHLQKLAPGLSELEIRKYLGGFGFSNETTLKPVEQFSGGEKSRLALALLVWQKPNLLLLDEPTNHLDMEMRTALSIAMQDYSGAVLLVSHDRYLLRTTVDQLILVANGRVEPFEGDLDDYQKWLINFRKEQMEIDRVENRSTVSKNELKKLEAEAREKRRPIEQKINKIEEKLERLQQRNTEIEARMADTELYDEAHKADLQALILDQAKIQKEISVLEAEWLQAHDSGMSS